MQDLVFFCLVVGLMLGGMAMIVGGPSLASRIYRQLFQTFLEKPFNWLIQKVKKKVAQTCRWLLRHLKMFGRQVLTKFWRLSVYTGRAIWIRLTT